MLIEIIGTLAALVQLVRLLPQVIKGFTTKSVGDVSTNFIILGITSTALWITYGALIFSIPIMFANSVDFIAYLLLIVQKRIY